MRCFAPIILYRCPCWAARYQFSKQTTDPLRLTLLLCSFELLNHLFPKLKQLWEKRFNHLTQHQIFSEPTNPTGFWAWFHHIPQSILQHFRANIPMFVGSGWSTPHRPPWPFQAWASCASNIARSEAPSSARYSTSPRIQPFIRWNFCV